MRVVLANLNADNGDSAALDAALALALPGAAHIRAFYGHEDPRLLATLASPEAASVVGSVLRAAEQDRADAVSRTRQSWTDWRLGNNLDEASSLGAAAPSRAVRPTTEYVEIVGDWPQSLGRAGRFADIVVLSRGGEARAAAGCEAALFTSGRPVLVVPDAAVRVLPPLLDTIVIAWDDRAEASRAIAAALPLLRCARKIHVLHCAENAPDPSVLEPVLAYLRWHGLDPAGTVMPPADAPVGETLTAAAEALDAGLIVMGAYGHGRLRELVFGGMTRHMLAHGRLPTLMMH